ncbi:MAG: 2-C-methyl-D-erythritol 4-phosphate cytidylyltransferase [Deinococcales bacterium]|nr:2-C-methyl-D-erythritol 4-phosphate cytidylyltransferase [Chitinophagaceae bacterium]
MKKFAVIVAGGNGLRMGSSLPKQFLLLQNKPLLWHTITTFFNAYAHIDIILVLPKSHLDIGKQIAATFANAHQITIVEGGETRFNSVKNGLAFVAPNAIVFVHDGVRCLVNVALVQRCFQQAVSKGSAIPAVAATDSIRIVHDTDTTVTNRNNIRIIQTPQTFKSDLLLAAFNQDFKDSFTDEATVVEAYGEKIFLIDGDYNNIKITRPIDLIIAEKILEERELLP